MRLGVQRAGAPGLSAVGALEGRAVLVCIQQGVSTDPSFSFRSRSAHVPEPANKSSEVILIPERRRPGKTCPRCIKFTKQ